MGKIQDLPTLERPREKAIRYGLESLSDDELIALIIASGYQGENVSDISHRLLSNYKGLYGLRNATFEELKSYKGIKQNKAISLLAVFEINRRLSFKESELSEEISPKYFYQKYRSLYEENYQEIVVLIVLNFHKKVIYETTLYKGTSKDVIFSYKDIWDILTLRKGKYFYLIHTHPRASSFPSRQDVLITKELFLHAKRNLTPMLDHIIIGEDGYYSFAENEKR